MEIAFQQYINYNLDLDGVAVYNAPYWIASKAGTTSFVQVPLNKNEMVKFIIIHRMSYSNTASGVVVHFTDSRFPTLPLMEFNNAFPHEGIFPFFHIVKARQFTMISSVAGVKFALLVQTVTQEKLRK